MPLPNFPPLTPGGQTIPRQLNRWLDKSFQGGPLTRTQTFVTLPSFAVTVTWNGYSDIVAAFNFEGPNSFSLMPFVAPANPNYALCISYIYQGTFTRYLMWNATGSNLNQVIPLYIGQPIKNNFRFEIWSTSQGNVSQSASLTFYTSVAGDLDYRFGQDLALVNNDPEVLNFNVNKMSPQVIPNLAYVFSAVGLSFGAPTWRDTTNTITLTFTGNINPQGGTPSYLQMTATVGYGSALSVNKFAFLFKSDASASSGTMLTVNGSTVITYNGSTNTITSNSNSFTFPSTSRWYIITISSTGTINVYDMLTGILQGTIASAIFPVNTTAFVFGGCIFDLADLMVCQAITSENTIVTYYTSTYSNTFNLPLIFPSNSTSVSN